MATNGYPFKEWNAGDVITKNALNNMEHGIADVVLIQETDPAIDNNVYSKGKYNKVWINPAIETVELPTYEELKAIEKLQRKPILCVSTYRDNFRSDTTEYYYAISYDGESFYEIKNSRGFAGTNLDSTDVQPLEINDGLLMICTAGHKNTGNNDSQATYDFKATFTKDFKTYYSSEVNLGFMDAAYSEDPYVWAPQIVKLDNKYYCIASISTQATVSGDIYYGSNSNETNTKYLRPYYIEIEINTNDDTLIITPASGASLTPLNIHLDDPNASIMDVSIMYSNSRKKLCAVYKDRIYNTVNMSESSNGKINGTFNDVYTYLGNIAYTEAGYLTSIGGCEYIYICNYLGRPIVLRHSLYPYNTPKDIIQGWKEVGSINSMHSFNDGTDAGMRNPYPIELSLEMAQKLFEVYDVPTTIPRYEVKKRLVINKDDAINKIITKVSDVIYNTFGKYTEYREKTYIPVSNTKIISEEEVNCDMCFLNEPTNIVINKTGNTTIKTPNGNITITKNTNSNDVFLITQGTAIKISTNIESGDIAFNFNTQYADGTIGAFIKKMYDDLFLIIQTIDKYSIALDSTKMLIYNQDGTVTWEDAPM